MEALATYFIFTVVGLGMLLVVGEIVGQRITPYPTVIGEGKPHLEIISGPHAGRHGKVVSIAWIGTLWNFRPVINVAATEEEILAQFGEGWGDRVGELVQEMKDGHGPRHWVKAWSSNVKPYTGD